MGPYTFTTIEFIAHFEFLAFTFINKERSNLKSKGQRKKCMTMGI
ncbi:hypothetical protein DOY81_011431 [Sarcophaga bullata]|nr:hypothetical protein DOY81_011431 [Sarcophaga bullata]